MHRVRCAREIATLFTRLCRTNTHKNTLNTLRGCDLHGTDANYTFPIFRRFGVLWTCCGRHRNAKKHHSRTIYHTCASCMVKMHVDGVIKETMDLWFAAWRAAGGVGIVCAEKCGRTRAKRDGKSAPCYSVVELRQSRRREHMNQSLENCRHKPEVFWQAGGWGCEYMQFGSSQQPCKSCKKEKHTIATHKKHARTRARGTKRTKFQKRNQ